MCSVGVPKHITHTHSCSDSVIATNMECCETMYSKLRLVSLYLGTKGMHLNTLPVKRERLGMLSLVLLMSPTAKLTNIYLNKQMDRLQLFTAPGVIFTVSIHNHNYAYLCISTSRKEVNRLLPLCVCVYIYGYYYLIYKQHTECRGYSAKQKAYWSLYVVNKYFELKKNSWGADGAPQTRTAC